MAFTLTKMRDTIITHVNKQSDKIQMFKEDSINKLVTYDCLKVSFWYYKVHSMDYQSVLKGRLIVSYWTMIHAACVMSYQLNLHYKKSLRISWVQGIG